MRFIRANEIKSLHYVDMFKRKRMEGIPSYLGVFFTLIGMPALLSYILYKTIDDGLNVPDSNTTSIVPLVVGYSVHIPITCYDPAGCLVLTQCEKANQFYVLQTNQSADIKGCIFDVTAPVIYLSAKVFSFNYDNDRFYIGYWPMSTPPTELKFKVANTDGDISTTLLVLDKIIDGADPILNFSYSHSSTYYSVPVKFADTTRSQDSSYVLATGQLWTKLLNALGGAQQSINQFQVNVDCGSLISSDMKVGSTLTSVDCDNPNTNTPYQITISSNTTIQMFFDASVTLTNFKSVSIITYKTSLDILMAVAGDVGGAYDPISWAMYFLVFLATIICNLFDGPPSRVLRQFDHGDEERERLELEASRHDINKGQIEPEDQEYSNFPLMPRIKSNKSLSPNIVI